MRSRAEQVSEGEPRDDLTLGVARGRQIYMGNQEILREGNSRMANRTLTRNAMWLDEKSRLSGPILRVIKVAQADANQAKPLVRAEADTFPQ